MNQNRQVFSAKIEGGKIVFHDQTGIDVWLSLLDNREVDITIEKETSKRTDPQNKAMHKYFTMVSDELTEQGITVMAILSALKLGVDLYPTPEIVKEIWRLFQKTQLKKQSTTELEKDNEVNLIYESVCKFLGENWNLYVEFPHKPDPRFQ